MEKMLYLQMVNISGIALDIEKEPSENEPPHNIQKFLPVVIVSVLS